MQILKQMSDQIILREKRNPRIIAIVGAIAIIAVLVFLYSISDSFVVMSCRSYTSSGQCEGRPVAEPPTIFDRIPVMAISLLTAIGMIWVTFISATINFTDYTFEKSSTTLTIDRHWLFLPVRHRTIQFDHIQARAVTSSLILYVMALDDIACSIAVSNEASNTAIDTVKRFFGSELLTKGMPGINQQLHFLIAILARTIGRKPNGDKG